MVSASTTPKSNGFSPAQIRALIALREEKLEEIGASALNVDPKRISETIDRKRRNETIRQGLCTYLNLPYEKLWGTAPINQQDNDGSEVAAA